MYSKSMSYEKCLERVASRGVRCDGRDAGGISRVGGLWHGIDRRDWGEEGLWTEEVHWRLRCLVEPMPLKETDSQYVYMCVDCNTSSNAADVVWKAACFRCGTRRQADEANILGRTSCMHTFLCLSTTSPTPHIRPWLHSCGGGASHLQYVTTRHNCNTPLQQE